MTKDEFRIVVRGIVTGREGILIGRKEEEEGHKMSGQWHFPGGHVDRGEELEDALRREVEEEVGIEVEVHQLLDAFRVYEGVLGIIYHCEAVSDGAEAGDSLEEVKWVEPEELEETLGEMEADVLARRTRLQNFVEKLKSVPTRGSL